VQIIPFGVLTRPDSQERRHVDLVTLESSALLVAVHTLGATLHTVEAPDRTGRRERVCLQLDTADEYHDASASTYIGATCGRWANRISGASYEVDDRRVQLLANDGDAHLHGGPDGFSRRVWDIAATTPGDDGGTVVLALHSPDGDQGHPGNLDVTATFHLHGHVLRITYEASTDTPTACTLTNHAYWNLAGPSAGAIECSIDDHELRVSAEHVLPVDHRSLPVGLLASVDATPYDLREPRPLDEVLTTTGGLDLAYAIEGDEDATESDGLHLAAELHHPGTGRTLTVATDQPALQVYSAERLGPPFQRRAAICLEAQQFPDAPNLPWVGEAFLRPGGHLRATTELTFGVR